MLFLLRGAGKAKGKTYPRFETLEKRRLLASTYYVSPTGSDSADGLSPATAWKSLSRVNQKNFDPGDRLLFEGGKRYAVSGSPGSNVLTNSNFENGLTGWSDTNGTVASHSYISTTVHSGSGSLKLDSAGSAIRAQSVTTKIKANQTYEISLWTKQQNFGAGDRRVGVKFYAGGKLLGDYNIGFRNSAWTQYKFSFVAPSGFESAELYCAKTNDASTMWVDDLVLRSLPTGLVFDHTDSGTSTDPVVLSTYGAGRAIISAGDGVGLAATNVSGFIVQNLTVIGTWNALTGSGPNSGQGVDIVNTLPNDTKLGVIRLMNVEAKGFRWAGVRIAGHNGKSGFSDVRLTNVSAHHNGQVGILVDGEFSRSSTTWAHEGIYIARSKAYGNWGIPGRGQHSGNGIQVNDVNQAIIERNVAFDNGQLNDYTAGGPVGIWTFDSNAVKIQRNESYANNTGSGTDGAGFDLDGGVTNSVMQYNYSHDNDGPGYLLSQFAGARTFGKNAVRYNISQNDGRKNGYGAVSLTGTNDVANVIVEHNTLYMSPATSGSPSGVRVKVAGGGVSVRNNIIMTSGGATLVEVDAGATAVRFYGNNYYSSGSSFRIKYNGGTYTSLSGWRATGQERYAGSATGTSINPRLSSPGLGTTLNDAYKLETLTQYRLRSVSPLIGYAAILSLPWKKYRASTLDYFGEKTPQGARRDVGAAEVG